MNYFQESLLHTCISYQPTGKIHPTIRTKLFCDVFYLLRTFRFNWIRVIEPGFWWSKLLLWPNVTEWHGCSWAKYQGNWSNIHGDKPASISRKSRRISTLQLLQYKRYSEAWVMREVINHLTVTSSTLAETVLLHQMCSFKAENYASICVYYDYFMQWGCCHIISNWFPFVWK